MFKWHYSVGTKMYKFKNQDTVWQTVFSKMVTILSPIPHAFCKVTLPDPSKTQNLILLPLNQGWLRRQIYNQWNVEVTGQQPRLGWRVSSYLPYYWFSCNARSPDTYSWNPANSPEVRSLSHMEVQSTMPAVPSSQVITAQAPDM